MERGITLNFVNKTQLEQQFSEHYEQYVERIFRFVYLKTNAQDTAEDITAEVFTRYWEHCRHNRPIKHHSGFLYSIARNLITDLYRQRGRVQIGGPEELKLGQQHSYSQIEALKLESDMEKVKLVLRQLNDEYQDLIIWHYLEELAVAEIAQILEKSEQAVRMQLSRALQALRVELARQTNSNLKSQSAK